MGARRIFVAACLLSLASPATAQSPHFGWTTQCQVDGPQQTIAVMNEPLTTDVTLGMPVSRIECGTQDNPLYIDLTILEHRAPSVQRISVFQDQLCVVPVRDELTVHVRTEAPRLETVDEGNYRAFVYDPVGCIDSSPSMAVDTADARFELAAFHANAAMLAELAWHAHSPLISDLDADMAYLGRLDVGGHAYIEGIDPTSRLWLAGNIDGDLVPVAVEAGDVAPYFARRTMTGRIELAARIAVMLVYAILAVLLLVVARPRLGRFAVFDALHAPAAVLLATFGFMRGAGGALLLTAGLFCVATRDEWSGGFLPGPSAAEATEVGAVLGGLGAILIASAAILIAGGVAGLRPAWRGGRIALWLGVAIVLVPSIAILTREVTGATLFGLAIALLELTLFAILLRGSRSVSAPAGSPPPPSPAPT